MIKFSIACDFSRQLPEKIDLSKVDEFYANFDFPGPDGARISESGFSRYLGIIHRQGVKFDYALEQVCLGNNELTIGGQKKLSRLFEWLIENKVYAVSVAIPYLAEFIKRNFPQLKIYAGGQAGVDCLERARFWESLGADKITLSAVSGINRNFRLLAGIRDGVKCALELCANLSCLNDCPFWTYHAARFSHAQTENGYPFECERIKEKDPVEFIRSGWIRPEDLGYYESVGINSIKLVNRNLVGEERSQMISAYMNRRYAGDLGRIINGIPGWLKIDNRKLDGFLGHFTQEECNLKICRDCNYCSSVFNQAAKVTR